MIDSVFYTLLTTNEALTGLLSGEVYMGFVPMPSDKYLMFQCASRSRPSTIDNNSSQQTVNYQIDCYGKSSVDVSAVIDAFVNEFHLKGAVVGGYDIQLIEVENESTSHDQETKMFGRRIDVKLYFN